MLNLNLAYPSRSDIKFTIKTYTDKTQDLMLQPGFDVDQPVTIKSYMHGMEDLGLIVCAAKALKRLKVKNVSLFAPYIMGGRADRQFVEGGTSYLVDVVAPIINSLNFDEVITIDPHSTVTEAVINNIVVQTCHEMIVTCIHEGPDDVQHVIISPDAGAMKKCYAIGEKLGLPVYCGTKYRNVVTNEISNSNIVIPEYNGARDFIIVDDICDGGRTFLDLAAAIRPQMKAGDELSLVVTHGLFSYGTEKLVKEFSGVYCTNSVNSEKEDVNVTDIF